MLASDLQAFALVFRSMEGKKAVSVLTSKLEDLDRISRKLRGDKLLENTIRRDTYSEIIEMFRGAEELYRKIPEKTEWS